MWCVCERLCLTGCAPCAQVSEAASELTLQESIEEEELGGDSGSEDEEQGTYMGLGWGGGPWGWGGGGCIQICASAMKFL